MLRFSISSSLRRRVCVLLSFSSITFSCSSIVFASAALSSFSTNVKFSLDSSSSRLNSLARIRDRLASIMSASFSSRDASLCATSSSSSRCASRIACTDRLSAATFAFAAFSISNVAFSSTSDTTFALLFFSLALLFSSACSSSSSSSLFEDEDSTYSCTCC